MFTEKFHRKREESPQAPGRPALLPSISPQLSLASRVCGSLLTEVHHS